MKKVSLLIVFLIASWNLAAQENPAAGKLKVIKPVQFGVSKPLAELFVDDDALIPEGQLKEMGDREHRKPQVFKYTSADGPNYREDMSVRQTAMGRRSARTPIANWGGQNATATPPDPSGAAGLNHYVQVVNSTRVKIFDKFSGASVGSIFSLGSLWTPAVPTLGDPVVLYDKYADRWVLTHLGTSNNKLHIAVSTSGDPAGTYYTYTFEAADFPDYPKYSIWADGYYMTSNYISPDPDFPDAVFCFERNEMLTGNPAARAIYSLFNPGPNGNFYVPMPADADGELPPFGTPMPMISYYENSWNGGDDSLQIWNVSVDWTQPTPTISVSEPESLLPAPFDGTYDVNWEDIPQPNTNARLDGMGGLIQFRAQWRKWTGYNTMVVCWPVNISSNPIQRSIRWAELRQDQHSGLWSIYQESTYAPDNYSRWISSIAMDDEGNIALCYAKSGPGAVTPWVYPSLGFTGRLAGDPLNTMTIDETMVISGTGTLSFNRFGDYSQTSLDPDGLTFWNTAEYVISPGTQRTRIYSFRLSPFTDVAHAETSEAQFVAYQAGNSLVVKAYQLPYNDYMVLDLFDFNGRIINSQNVSPTMNQFSALIDISTLAKGSYLVRIGKMNTNFQKIIKVGVH